MSTSFVMMEATVKDTKYCGSVKTSSPFLPSTDSNSDHALINTGAGGGGRCESNMEDNHSLKHQLLTLILRLLHTCLVAVVAVLVEQELRFVALHIVVFSSFQGLWQQVVEAKRTIEKEQLKHPVERCFHPMLVWWDFDGILRLHDSVHTKKSFANMRVK